MTCSCDISRATEIRAAAARAASLATEIDRTASERREDAKAAELLRRRVESERDRAEKAMREAAAADADALAQLKISETAVERRASDTRALAEQTFLSMVGGTTAGVLARETPGGAKLGAVTGLLTGVARAGHRAMFPLPREERS